MRRILSCLLLLNLSIENIAYAGFEYTFFKGADAEVIHACDGQVVEALLPSKRWEMERRLRNFRFLGDYDDHDAQISPHHQMRLVQEPYLYPQEPVAAVLQTLFPSPDGDLFIVNQAIADAAANLLPGPLGILVNALHFFHAGNIDASELQKRLDNALGVKPKYVKGFSSFLAAEEKDPTQCGAFSNDRYYYRKARLSQLLYNAAQHLKNNKTMYPGDILEQALSTYLWKRAQTLEDVQMFYIAATGDMEIPLFVQEFSAEDFNTLTDQLNSTADVVTMFDALSQEQKTLMLHGDVIFSSTGFHPLDYASAFVDGQKFPNCIETAIQNVILCITRKFSKERGVYFDPKLLLPSPGRAVLEQYPRLTDQGQNARNLWAKTMAHRAGIRYKKEGFEISAGWRNIVNVLIHLLGKDLPLLGESATPQNVVDHLQKLIHSLSMPDFLLDVILAPEDLKPTDRQDLAAIATVTLNGESFFAWHVGAHHSYIEPTHGSVMDQWKKQYILTTTGVNFKTRHYRECETPKDLALLSRAQLQTLAFLNDSSLHYSSLPITSLPEILPLLESTVTQAELAPRLLLSPEMLPLFFGIVRQIGNLDDGHPMYLFLSPLNSYPKSDIFTLFFAHIERILRYAPRLIDSSACNSYEVITWIMRHERHDLFKLCAPFVRNIDTMREKMDFFERHELYPCLTHLERLNICESPTPQFLQWYQGHQFEQVSLRDLEGLNYPGTVDMLVNCAIGTISIWNLSIGTFVVEKLPKLESLMREVLSRNPKISFQLPNMMHSHCNQEHSKYLEELRKHLALEFPSRIFQREF